MISVHHQILFNENSEGTFIVAFLQDNKKGGCPYLHAVDGIFHCEVVKDLQQNFDNILPPVEVVIVQHHPVKSRPLSCGCFPAHAVEMFQNRA